MIDEERRQQYGETERNFETRYALVLTYMPPEEATSRALRFFVEGGEERTVDWGEQLTLFSKRLEDLEDRLAARLEIRRMGSEALLRHLRFCLTGLDHPFCLDGPACYLDALLADQDLVGGFAPRIGRHHLAPLAITGFPASSSPGILDFLGRLAMPYRFSSRWLPLESETAQKHLRRLRRKWWQKRRGLTDLVMDALQPPRQIQHRTFSNQDAVEMAKDANRAISEAASTAVRYGYYTAVIVLKHEDRAELDEAVRRVLRELRHRGFGARLEEVNALEAFLGSLPGHGYPNVRRPLISSRNLAHLLPVTSVWAGRAENPCPFFPAGSPALLWAATSGSTPFRLNLHVSDVGHTLVIGPTGAGKSTLLGLLAAQWFRYEGAQVFTFDKGFSAMPLVRAAGGDHYDIDGESTDRLSFYPLAGIDDPRERSWAMEWLETLFDLQGLAVGPGQREAIGQALEVLATSPSRTLTDLQVRLQNTELRQALRPYTLEGNLGTLLDARSDGLLDGCFQVFEMSHLMERRQKVVVPVLLYLFHRIEQRLDGRPTLLIIDEAWTFLMHGLFADRIQTWLKELRKKNAVVVFATQSLADIRRSDKRQVIYESCPTKILLPNAEATGEHIADLYREIGLNGRELEILATAPPKRHYYHVSPEGRRLLDFTLGPLALAFLGAGDKESLRRIDYLANEDPVAWPGRWLEEKGLATWTERLKPTKEDSR